MFPSHDINTTKKRQKMSQKENTNTFVVCSLKGGVGTTTISSEILATLLHREDRTVTIYRPDSFIIRFI